jgi:peptide chain release factor 1
MRSGGFAMLQKLQAVQNRFEELCARSEQPDFYNDPKKAAAILREKNDLEPLMDALSAYRAAIQEMEDAQALMSEPDMKEFCQQTYQEAKVRSEALYKELQILLLPKDPNDEKSVIV